MPLHRLRVLRGTLQVTHLAYSLWVCFSRVSDYKHHWSDVLSGAIIGTIVALVIVRSLIPLPLPLPLPPPLPLPLSHYRSNPLHYAFTVHMFSSRARVAGTKYTTVRLHVDAIASRSQVFVFGRIFQPCGGRKVLHYLEGKRPPAGSSAHSPHLSVFTNAITNSSDTLATVTELSRQHSRQLSPTSSPFAAAGELKAPATALPLKPIY